MQLREASLPPSLGGVGGVGGSSVYVDAEGSFSPTRSGEIAESLVRHAKAMQEKRGADGAMTEPRRLPTSLTGAASRPPRSECDIIHVFRVNDEASNGRHSAYPALVLQPPPGLWPPFRAVESMAFHCRYMPNVASRNRSRVHLGVPRGPCPRALLAVILVN